MLEIKTNNKDFVVCLDFDCEYVHYFGVKLFININECVTFVA